MDQWENKIAVVTGASSGIGASIALDLTRSGMIVIGLARRKDRIEALRNQLSESCANNLHAIYCDITSEESVKTAFNLIEENYGGIDVLINNAGVLKFFNLIDMDNMSAIHETINTNVIGLVMCTREAFKSMKRRNVNGHIVLINSILGHSTPYVVGKLPSYNMYNASKYAVTSLTEVYRQEFQKFGNKVKISSISPGFVQTEMVLPEHSEVLTDAPYMRPEDISQAVLYVLGTPPHVQVHELIIKPMGEQL